MPVKKRARTSKSPGATRLLNFFELRAGRRLVDLPYLVESGADGIGLFRTELQFMIASHLPRVGEQIELYREAIRLSKGKPIVFRLLDVGGDKVIPYLRAAPEENPAMGFRSLRLALDRPASELLGDPDLNRLFLGGHAPAAPGVAA